nr:uncharacterized protein LOC109167446 [Ipomoea trifida]
MKKLSSSTVIGNKRKLPYSASQENLCTTPKNSGSSPLLIYGIFQKSLATPLSVLNNDGNVVNTTIRNTAEDYMMGQTSDNRIDKGTTCDTNNKQLTGSENSTYIGTITGTPKNRFNVTLGSKNSLPLSDITNCNGTIRSKKIKGSLTLTGVSTIENNVNAHKRSERSQSYFLGISRPNITQESDSQVVICRDLSQDFDEVMVSEVQSGN